eukprot:9041858-Alexandrium_andersonii.AAC.1
MSASLVGSEMCIRDRAQTRPQDLRPEAPEERALHRFLCADAESADAAGRRCLLYTSDAADDM